MMSTFLTYLRVGVCVADDVGDLESVAVDDIVAIANAVCDTDVPATCTPGWALRLQYRRKHRQSRSHRCRRRPRLHSSCQQRLCRCCELWVVVEDGVIVGDAIGVAITDDVTDVVADAVSDSIVDVVIEADDDNEASADATTTTGTAETEDIFINIIDFIIVKIIV